MNGPSGDPISIPFASHSGAFVQDMAEDFHLVVSLDGTLTHYWRNNRAGRVWNAGPHIPIPDARGHVLVAPTDVELTQQTVNIGRTHQLQLIARFGTQLFQYTFDQDNQAWSTPVEVTTGHPAAERATGHPALVP